MGLLTRKTDSNPLSKNIDELLDGMNQEREETKEGTYEESLKKMTWVGRMNNIRISLYKA